MISIDQMMLEKIVYKLVIPLHKILLQIFFAKVELLKEHKMN